MPRKNEVVTVDREALMNASHADASMLQNAINARIGDTSIEVLQDSDGNEFAKATFELATPKGDKKTISITDMDLATRIEATRRSFALGDVSVFMQAKQLENFTATDAVALGFESATELCMSLFGLAKSTVENYRRLARFFVNDDYTVIPSIPSDVPISTLNQLLSYVTVNEDGTHDTSNVEKLFTSGIITPYMKQSEVKARLAWLKSQDSEIELSDMSEDDIAILKNSITEDSAKRKEEKSTKSKEKSKEKSNSNSVTVSDNPQVVIGEILSMMAKIDGYATNILEIEKNDEIRQHIDALIVLFTDKVNEIE